MAQFDWKVLGQKVKGYAGGTTAATILADITANSVANAIDVPSRTVRATLYAMGAWSAIVKKATAANLGTDTSEAATACQMIVSMAESGDVLPMTNPAIAAALTADINAIATAGVITQDQATAALGLANSSWAAQNGWSGVSVDQVAYAQSSAIQNDPALGIN
jgi:hypothetical protein